MNIDTARITFAFGCITTQPKNLFVGYDHGYLHVLHD